MSTDRETPTDADAGPTGPSEPAPAEVAPPPAAPVEPPPPEAPAPTTFPPPDAVVEPAPPLEPAPDLGPPIVPAPAPRPPMDSLTRAMWIVAAVGALIRLIFVMWVHKPMDFDYSDMHSYIERARQMATPGHVTSNYDWYYPSGTSFFISLFLRAFGMRAGWTVAALFQALMSGAEIPLLYFAAARFFSRRVALGAATLFAFHYLSIGYAGFFMSENYLTIGLIGACALLVPDRPLKLLAAGLLLGLGAWAKSQAVLLAPMWGLVLWLRGQRKSAVAVTGTAIAVVAAVSAYVSVVNHAPTFISYNGGQTFALGQCPIRAIVYSDPVSHTGAGFTLPVQNQRFERGEVEASWGEAHYTEPFFHSSYYMREGFKCIRRWPMHALRMVFFHVVDTFAGPPWSLTVPWPDSHTNFRIFSQVSNLFVSFVCAPLAFIGLWLRRRDVGMWLFFALPMASVLASAVLFHGDSRFRCPYDFGIFIAACAAVELGWQRRHPEPTPAPAATPPTAGQPA